MARQTFFDPRTRQAALAMRWNADFSVSELLIKDRVVADIGDYDLADHAVHIDLPNGKVATVQLVVPHGGDDELEWRIQVGPDLLVGGRIDDTYTVDSRTRNDLPTRTSIIHAAAPEVDLDTIPRQGPTMSARLADVLYASTGSFVTAPAAATALDSLLDEAVPSSASPVSAVAHHAVAPFDEGLPDVELSGYRPARHEAPGEISSVAQTRPTASTATAAPRSVLAAEAPTPIAPTADSTAASPSAATSTSVTRRMSPRSVLVSTRTIGPGHGVPSGAVAGAWAVPDNAQLVDATSSPVLSAAASPYAYGVDPFATDADTGSGDDDSHRSRTRPWDGLTLNGNAATALGVAAFLCNIAGALSWGRDLLLVLDLLVALAAGGALLVLGRAFATDRLDASSAEPLVATCAASLSMMWAALHLSDHPSVSFVVFTVNGVAAMHFARVSLSVHAAELAHRARSAQRAAATALLAA